MVCSWQLPYQDSTDHGDNIGCGNDNTPGATDPRSRNREKNLYNCVEHTRWNSDEHSFELAVAKTTDYEGGKRGDAT